MHERTCEATRLSGRCLQVIYEQLEEEGIDIEGERLTIIVQHLTAFATSTTRSFHLLRIDSIRVTECECHLNV